MSLLRRKPADTIVEEAPVPAAPVVGKGRPTPKRSVAEGRRGPVAPPPKTQREAVKRARTTTKPMTKEEKKVASAERRERMMRGDDAYVLPRDKGPVRAYIRDEVDRRRNLAGLLAPIAVIGLVALMIPGVSVLQVYAPAVLLIAMLAAVADTWVFTRSLRRRVDAKFPKGDPSGLSTKGASLGFYALNRAFLPRRWRVPRTRVTRGAAA